MSKFGTLRPEVKTKWVEALRSGQYEQGRNFLHQADGRMCCLGVLCHLAEQDGVVVARPLQDENGTGVFAYGAATTMPPHVVTAWAFAEEPATGQAWTVPTGEGSDGLAGLNDEDGLTFEEIADLIEVAL